MSRYKNENLHSIMSKLQPNCCLQVDFQKLDQYRGDKELIHDTKRRKDNQLQSLKLPCRISKLSSYMWHKGVGWHYVESDILKEVVGAKTVGKPKKTKSGIQHKNCATPKNSPINCDRVQLHQYRTTLLVSFNKTHTYK